MRFSNLKKKDSHMAKLKDFPEPMFSHLANLPCPSFDTHPWIGGPALSKRRVAIISTAGLHRRGDRPFESMTGDYRIIPGDIKAQDLVMTHISTNFDRTGFMQDWNVVFPLDRLRAMASQKIIGTVADYHYSFMGASDPATMVPAARNLAELLKGDAVDAALLVPV
jgi:D-proline reductase (dithiol) PrdB